MTSGTIRRAFAVAVAVAFALIADTTRADEVPLVTGVHWTKSSEEAKKAYLIGVANVLQLDSAYHAANPPSDAQSIVPRAVRGLRGHTLDSVRQALNRWYAANPDRLQRPVLETIWFEVVLPAKVRQGG
jgi:hypothetical protein